MPTKGISRVYLVLFLHAEEETTLKDIPVVNEFSVMFLDEISGLSSKRVVEFAIGLMPRAGPILKAPYRIATNEIAELKRQIEERLEKGFI